MKDDYNPVKDCHDTVIQGNGDGIDRGGAGISTEKTIDKNHCRKTIERGE